MNTTIRMIVDLPYEPSLVESAVDRRLQEDGYRFDAGCLQHGITLQFVRFARGPPGSPVVAYTRTYPHLKHRPMIDRNGRRLPYALGELLELTAAIKFGEMYAIAPDPEDLRTSLTDLMVWFPLRRNKELGLNGNAHEVDPAFFAEFALPKNEGATYFIKQGVLGTTHQDIADRIANELAGLVARLRDRHGNHP